MNSFSLYGIQYTISNWYEHPPQYRENLHKNCISPLVEEQCDLSGDVQTNKQKLSPQNIVIGLCLPCCLFHKLFLQVSSLLGNTHLHRQAMADVQKGKIERKKKQDGCCATECTICLSARRVSCRRRQQMPEADSGMERLCVTLLPGVTFVSQTGSRCTVTVILLNFKTPPASRPGWVAVAGRPFYVFEFASSTNVFAMFPHCKATQGSFMVRWVRKWSCVAARRPRGNWQQTSTHFAEISRQNWQVGAIIK